MAEISFYHVTQNDVEKTAAKLLEKVLGAGLRAHVYVSDDARKEQVDTIFWTYQSASFLPHGTAEKGNPGDHPIFIASDLKVQNGATILVPLDPIEVTDFSGYDRCLDLFDGKNDTFLDLARNRWKAYKKAGHSLTYWRQSEDGQWVKQDI